MRLILKLMCIHGEELKYCTFRIAYLHPKYIESYTPADEHGIRMSPAFIPVYGSECIYISTVLNYKECTYVSETEEAWHDLLDRVLKFNQEGSNNTLEREDILEDI